MTDFLDAIYSKLKPKNSKKAPPGGSTEYHVPFMNFAGPNTNLAKRLKRGDKPVNMPDRASMKHDIAYGEIEKRLTGKSISKEEAMKQVRSADLQMLAYMRLNSYDSGSYFEKSAYAITRGSILSKLALENIGVIDPLKFVS